MLRVFVGAYIKDNGCATGGFSMDLLREWADWKRNRPPFVLESDQVVFSSIRSARAVITTRNWPEAHRAADFCAPKDRRFHLGLLPQPFCGDLLRASIYILLLTPVLVLPTTTASTKLRSTARRCWQT